MISVEYRLWPEHSHPAPGEDCCVRLKWGSEHASELGIDATKIMIAGLQGVIASFICGEVRSIASMLMELGRK